MPTSAHYARRSASFEYAPTTRHMSSCPRAAAGARVFSYAQAAARRRRVTPSPCHARCSPVGMSAGTLPFYRVRCHLSLPSLPYHHSPTLCPPPRHDVWRRLSLFGMSRDTPPPVCLRVCRRLFSLRYTSWRPYAYARAIHARRCYRFYADAPCRYATQRSRRCCPFFQRLRATRIRSPPRYATYTAVTPAAMCAQRHAPSRSVAWCLSPFGGHRQVLWASSLDR